MSDAEHIMNHRTGATRGVVGAVYDTGLVQTMDVTTHDGVVRGAAEVHQPFGFAAVPPQNGAVTVLVANGGDPSDMVAMPASCPAARLGGLQPGEVAIYAADGTRVHIRTGGIVDIVAASQVIISAPSGVTITGNVTINGTLDVTGSATIHGSLTASGGESITGNLSVSGNITAGGTISGG